MQRPGRRGIPVQNLRRMLKLFDVQPRLTDRQIATRCDCHIETVRKIRRGRHNKPENHSSVARMRRLLAEGMLGPTDIRPFGRGSSH